MLKGVTEISEHYDFINSFFDDSKFCDPHLTAMIEAGEKIEDMMAKKDHHGFVTVNNEEITGLFILLIISEEKYLEMLIGLTRDENSVKELLSFMGKNFPGYEADFVFNPNNCLIKDILEKHGADFDKEQIKMVYTHKSCTCDVTCIEPLSAAYNDQYLALHSKDMYWTGEKIIQATDCFKTFVAVEGGIVTGYIDVTHCHAENEPYDLYVRKEYRRKGYGRQLLAMALIDNEPKDMMVLVDYDNIPAINLYESMGFVKKKNGNILTAFWKINDFECDAT